eukprot:Gb_06858 [translate_table: standard]
MGVIASKYLGLFNASSNKKSYNHLFAVEFDTNYNVDFEENNSNHVGVDHNSLEFVESHPVGYWIGKSFKELNLKSGDNIQAWIDYYHTLNQLNVANTLDGLDRPINPLISIRKYLFSILKENMYVGFCASTTFDTIEYHYILAWSFSTNSMAPPLDLSHLPSLKTQVQI